MRHFIKASRKRTDETSTREIKECSTLQKKPGKKKSNHTLHRPPSKHNMKKKTLPGMLTRIILTFSTNLTTKENGMGV